MRTPLTLGFLLLAAFAAPPAPVLADTAAAAETAPDAKLPSLPTITVARVTRQHLAERIIASGLIGPVEEVQVAPLIEGQPVDALLADVGDRVAEGAVLARLSTATLDLQKIEALAGIASAKAAVAQSRAQLVEAEAGAAEAERVLARATTLREQGTTPQATWDAANTAKIAADARLTLATQTLEVAGAQLALADAQLATVKLYLARAEVKAPVAGAIVARNAKLGSVASAAGLPMFVIIRDDQLELRADVAETDVARLAPGMVVAIRAVGQSLPLEGSIRRVDPVIDIVTRLGMVRIGLEDAGPLRSGMFAEAEILLAEREGLAVPVTALGRSETGPTVMRVRDGVVAVVPVVIGIRDGALVEITEGLAEGDLVVAKAGAFVRNGDRVNPVQPAEPQN